MPRSELTVSMNDSVYGLYGRRPFWALFERNEPTRTVMPEFEPWPAMPLFATDPLRLMIRFEKSAPLTVGTYASNVGLERRYNQT